MILKLNHIVICFLALLFLLQVQQASAQYTYRWTPTDQFYLSAGFLKPFGVEDLVPFGYRLDNGSAIPLHKGATGVVSDPLPVTEQRYFSTVRYAFRDSMVTAATLTVKNISDKRAGIEKVLDQYFGHADYKNVRESVYSDEDFAVNLRVADQTLSIVSLDHQALEEQAYPNINLRNYGDNGLFWYDADTARAIGLAFYNQVTKENNVQPAFRLYYRSPVSINLKSVVFELGNGKKISFPVNTITEKGLQKVTRCYWNYETGREILRSEKVTVCLQGTETVRYVMPAYQRHSLQTAVQFYKENVTNPLLQYKGW
ncbi:hypothetical protein [Deminuibacter soli]|uniref:Uncharacterized protein n=1 Tax=Deminuibacter soli TaxID=2291815 RepID=A0A3E1NGV7_9BACT|nr:hypothetical protein [Deminuibacter soli]RFM27028.1 hypothetical protein DXN05_16280 [Deminuibacter soli]